MKLKKICKLQSCAVTNFQHEFLKINFKTNNNIFRSSHESSFLWMESLLTTIMRLFWIWPQNYGSIQIFAQRLSANRQKIWLLKYQLICWNNWYSYTLFLSKNFHNFKRCIKMWIELFEIHITNNLCLFEFMLSCSNHCKNRLESKERHNVRFFCAFNVNA